ncbi:MAG: efflux RND transporter periplasmic adaptor subunit [Candidatus Kapabacteria bacterium]|nr:efflux RND transporter periplasmic adaptor subunit [Candidatus Kapabacteria bacterium]
MKPTFRYLAPLTLGAVIVINAFTLSGCGSKTEVKAADGPQAQNLSADSKNAAQRVMNAEKIVAIGRVEPEQEITALSMDASGIVKKVLVEDGDNVKAGQALIELLHDVESAKLSLSQAKANTQAQEVKGLRAQLASATAKLQNQKEKYERIQKIFESGAETRQNADNAKTDYETAQREVERLQAGLQSAESKVSEFNADARVSSAEVERRMLRAPSDGTVLKLEPNVGSAVTSGKSVGDFAPKSPLTVLCEVDELFVNDVKIGQKASIRRQGMTETIADGTVVSVGAYLKKKSLFSDEAGALEDRRVREVRVRLSNPGTLLLNSRVECVILTK